MGRAGQVPLFCVSVMSLHPAEDAHSSEFTLQQGNLNSSLLFLSALYSPVVHLNCLCPEETRIEISVLQISSNICSRCFNNI